MLYMKDTTIIKKTILAAGILIVSLLLLTFAFNGANIIMILQSAGVHVSKGIANALTTIGGVYGVQQFLLSALGVTVPLWAAAAVAATGAAGV